VPAMAPATKHPLLSLPRALAGLPRSLPLLQLRFLSLQHNHGECKHIMMQHHIKHCTRACSFDCANVVHTKNKYSKVLCLQKQPACCVVRHSVAQLT